MVAVLESVYPVRIESKVCEGNLRIKGSGKLNGKVWQGWAVSVSANKSSSIYNMHLCVLSGDKTCKGGVCQGNIDLVELGWLPNAKHKIIWIWRLIPYTALQRRLCTHCQFCHRFYTAANPHEIALFPRHENQVISLTQNWSTPKCINFILRTNSDFLLLFVNQQF